MLYASLQALGRDPRQEALGVGLYFNLLTLAQIGRLSVQQVDETGFDQFQKYTFVGTRARIEKRYAARFRQLNAARPTMCSPISKAASRRSPPFPRRGC